MREISEERAVSGLLSWCQVKIQNFQGHYIVLIFLLALMGAMSLSFDQVPTTISYTILHTFLS